MIEKFLDNAQFSYIESVNIELPHPEHSRTPAVLSVEALDEVDWIFLARKGVMNVAKDGEAEPGGGETEVPPCQQEVSRDKEEEKGGNKE